MATASRNAIIPENMWGTGDSIEFAAFIFA
jgi:hypothetical protein